MSPVLELDNGNLVPITKLSQYASTGSHIDPNQVTFGDNVYEKSGIPSYSEVTHSQLLCQPPNARLSADLQYVRVLARHSHVNDLLNHYHDGTVTAQIMTPCQARIDVPGDLSALVVQSDALFYWKRRHYCAIVTLVCWIGLSHVLWLRIDPYMLPIL
jgi:hypothetical protein